MSEFIKVTFGRISKAEYVNKIPPGYIKSTGEVWYNPADSDDKFEVMVPATQQRIDADYHRTTSAPVDRDHDSVLYNDGETELAAHVVYWDGDAVTIISK